jgi:RsiW-degrading membrane proteinase PrsW (M82 family)
VLSRLLAAGFLACLVTLPAWFLYRRMVLGRGLRVDRSQIASVFAFSLGLGVLCHLLEGWLWKTTELSPLVTESGPGSWLSMLLFAAPLEEGAKVAAIWPQHLRQRLSGRFSGFLLGVWAGAGFALGEASAAFFSGPFDSASVLRYALGIVPHVFCASSWGYVLAHSRIHRWFPVAWLGLTFVHAVYDHIVFGRGPGMLAWVMPLLAFMVILFWSTLSAFERAPSARIQAGLALSDPPPLRVIGQMLGRPDQRLKPQWVLVGAFVTLGVGLTCLAFGVYVGHRMGIDFALASESDVRSNGPIALLGTALMSAFPISGFLVTRASAATSVSEAAFGAGFAIIAVIVGLAFVTPAAVIFALVLAPVAFALACAGAWFGLSR